MITLKEIDENNWLRVAQLETTKEQKQFVASSVGIMARAYAMRGQNARAYAIAYEKNIVGVLLVRDLEEEPACYDLQQFLIDYRYQNKGYGKQALRLIIDQLEREHKYDCIEVCVKMNDAAAIHIYQKVGFTDSGYIDPGVPDSYNMIYRFR